MSTTGYQRNSNSRVTIGSQDLAAGTSSPLIADNPSRGHGSSAPSGGVDDLRMTGDGAPRGISPLVERVRGEYREMPGLRLTVRQAARLFGVTPDVADAVLHELQRVTILARSDDGAFFMVRDSSFTTRRPRASAQNL